MNLIKNIAKKKKNAICLYLWFKVSVLFKKTTDEVIRLIPNISSETFFLSHTVCKFAYLYALIRLHRYSSFGFEFTTLINYVRTRSAWAQPNEFIESRVINNFDCTRMCSCVWVTALNGFLVTTSI
jgi:hypothetical protein